MAGITSIADEAWIALDNVADRAAGLVNPSLRLGVTGLSRSGKTVFITALVHNLLHGGRLPLFDVQHSGRLARAVLEPQPDDEVPRFQYEDHIAALVDERRWPESTRAISELRLTVEFESASGWNRLFSRGRLSVDIVDYPGEWLLDLPLLGQDFAQFSANALELARSPTRREMAGSFLRRLEGVDPSAPADEAVARELAAAFTSYLNACRADEKALSTLPPGRFLMPGDLEGSPALTFAPLDPAKGGGKNSIAAMMERRYESYKRIVVKPFFRDHFARLDRQVVLIDALHAMNAGHAAVADLERALSDILACFRPGRTNVLSAWVTRRIDRLLVAATKADHLHHGDHRKLEAIARRLVDRAIKRADFSGAAVDVVAMAAIRATREATVQENGESLPVIVGTPMEGETIAGERFNGMEKTAIFPGDLPDDVKSVFEPGHASSGASPGNGPIRFVRFRPPELERSAEGVKLSLPHIRLDRAMQFLLGDRFA